MTRRIPGGVLAARGFRGAAVYCGVKSDPKSLDLALIFSDLPASAAAMFTRNRFCAAPVQVSRRHARRGRARAIVANSGNANACTGPQGIRDAEEMCARTAAALGLRPQEVLVASTGRIGIPLPMPKICAGIAVAARSLARGREPSENLARAIMTTDTFPKSFATSVGLGRGTIRIGGIAKGAGMIAPQMATMFCFITTDAAIAPPLLRAVLRDAVEKSFNSVTVDGDTSTNDTVAILANGAADAAPIEAGSKAHELFAAALADVAQELAMMLARDGEGATRLITVSVTGARTERDAKTVARAVAESLLVKTAMHGGDPNWGRIACAVGYSGVKVDPSRVCISLQGTSVLEKGLPCHFDEPRLAASMRGREISIAVELGQGHATARIWTCDLSREYVTINADYHT